MVKRGSPERAVQVTLRRWLDVVLPAGSVTAAVKNEHAAASADPMGRARFHAKRKAEGVVAGFPDLVVLLPGGRTLLIEVKAPRTGVISDAQAGLHTRLRSMGHTVIVATCIEDARGGLLAAGVKPREAPGQAVSTARVRVAKPKGRLRADAVPW